MPDIKQPYILAGNLSGVVGPANGGTGFSSYTVGDMLYANTTTTLAKLADVAAGAVLVSGGVGVAPAWSTSPTVSGQFSANGGAVIAGNLNSTGSFSANGTTASFFAADVSIGGNTGGSRTLVLNGAVASVRTVTVRTAGVARWNFGSNGTAESGSNTGSDFIITRFDDAGASLGSALTITRSTGDVGVAGTVTVSTGDVIVGSSAGAKSFIVVGPAGTFRLNRFRTAALARWDFGVDGTAESGANVGSDFVITRFDDSGVGINTPFKITRSTGLTTLAGLSVGPLSPDSDNFRNLGTASLRWKEVFAASALINTSDAREKKWLGPLSATELAVSKRLAGSIGMFQWLASLEEKGEAARLHAGLLAQDVQAAFVAEGLDADRYGMFTYDTWEARPEEREAVYNEDGTVDLATYGPTFNITAEAVPEGNRYGLRYTEVLAFIVAGQEQRLSALEAGKASWWARVRARLRPAAA